jgi:hypothetical protein
MEDSQIWIEFEDRATAVDFKEIWLDEAEGSAKFKATRPCPEDVFALSRPVGSGEA